MKLTQEQRNISQRNQRRAWKLLGYTKDNHKGLCLHHIDETLRHTDIERYIQWNPEDLVVMTMVEHTKLHNPSQYFTNRDQEWADKCNATKIKNGTNKHSEETKAKISAANKGKKHGGNTGGYKIEDTSNMHHEAWNKGKHYKTNKPSGTTGKKWKLVNGRRVYYVEQD